MSEDLNLNLAAKELGLSLKGMYELMLAQGVKSFRRRDPRDPLSKLKTECVSSLDFEKLKSVRLRVP